MRSLHTPQQETNVAYNPGVTFRGGEFIAQGISQAGNAISAGLQRYAQNREESAALDMSFQTRAQPLLEEMQKFSAKDSQVSPAAGLVDKGADWHKFSSSQKKAFLADVVIMGDKQDRARRQQQEDDFRKAAQQFQQDQFTEQKKQNQTAVDRNYTQDALNALYRHQTNMRNLDADRRDDARLNLAQQGYEATQARFGRQEQESEAQRGAVGGFLRDFNQFAEGPQFNGTGMQRPMGQFEAYRQAAGANPRAFTPQMMDDLGRMAVSEDRLGAGRSAEPSVFTDPNGNQWVRHGNNPLQRSKTEEQIAAELAARSAPRAMAPEGSVEGIFNGVKVLVGPDGRIYKMPAVNPLTELLRPPATNSPPPTPSGAPVVRWGLDANRNPVKLP